MQGNIILLETLLLLQLLLQLYCLQDVFEYLNFDQPSYFQKHNEVHWRPWHGTVYLFLFYFISFALKNTKKKQKTKNKNTVHMQTLVIRT